MSRCSTDSPVTGKSRSARLWPTRPPVTDRWRQRSSAHARWNEASRRTSTAPPSSLSHRRRRISTTLLSDSSGRSCAKWMVRWSATSRPKPVERSGAGTEALAWPLEMRAIVDCPLVPLEGRRRTTEPNAGSRSLAAAPEHWHVVARRSGWPWRRQDAEAASCPCCTARSRRRRRCRK